MSEPVVPDMSVATFVTGIILLVMMASVLAHNYRGMSRRPRRIFTHNDLVLLDEVPLHGTIRTPATIIFSCPIDSPWEVQFKVGTDARLYEFAVPREQMSEVALSKAKKAMWGSESLMLGKTHLLENPRKKAFSVMVDLPEDEVNMTIVLPLKMVRKALRSWDAHTPIADDGLSDRVDEELANLLSEK